MKNRPVQLRLDGESLTDQDAQFLLERGKATRFDPDGVIVGSERRYLELTRSVRLRLEESAVLLPYCNLCVRNRGT